MTHKTLILYKNILKAAKYFPSIKRDRIIAEIKNDFHKNKNLTDNLKVEQCLRVAERGLADLEAYLPKDDSTGGFTMTLKGATL